MIIHGTRTLRMLDASRGQKSEIPPAKCITSVTYPGPVNILAGFRPNIEMKFSLKFYHQGARISRGPKTARNGL